jgi:type I site-specific restriction endonuclease
MTVVRLNPDTYEVVKKIAEQTGRSITEVVSEAVNAYYRGLSPEGKQIKRISDIKPWVLKHSGKCSSCGRELKQGERVMYQFVEYEDKSRKHIFICLDCANEETSLAKLYIKKFQLEKTVKGLKKLADSYAEQLATISRIQDFYQTVHDITRELRVLRDYLRQYSHPKEVLEIVTRFTDKLESLESRVREVEEGLRELVLPRIKKAMREA